MTPELQRIIARIKEVLDDECHIGRAPCHYGNDEALAWINGKSFGLERAIEIIKEESGK